MTGTRGAFRKEAWSGGDSGHAVPPVKALLERVRLKRTPAVWVKPLPLLAAVGPWRWELLDALVRSLKPWELPQPGVNLHGGPVWIGFETISALPLRAVAPEHALDGSPVWGGERDVGQLGEEEPLLISLEPAGCGEIENGERHAMMREGISEESERLGHRHLAIADRRWIGERGELPQAAPAGSGLLLQEDAATAGDPRAVFAHGDGFGARFFDGEEFGISRAALFADGAEQALRLVRRAEERAEFHECGGVEASAGFGEEVFGRFP